MHDRGEESNQLNTIHSPIKQHNSFKLMLLLLNRAPICACEFESKHDQYKSTNIIATKETCIALKYTWHRGLDGSFLTAASKLYKIKPFHKQLYNWKIKSDDISGLMLIQLYLSILILRPTSRHVHNSATPKLTLANSSLEQEHYKQYKHSSKRLGNVIIFLLTRKIDKISYVDSSGFWWQQYELIKLKSIIH
jgi:hypothetical protein